MVGIIPIFKPTGCTSYDVIRQIKKKSEEKKIGHGGTLDPFAEGVLVVAIGREATKKLVIILNHTLKTLTSIGTSSKWIAKIPSL
jgi:tRNA pseudouridine55 synthase